MLPSRSRPMPPVATSSPGGGKRYKLSRAAAAVHVEDRAMDETGLVAGQVADRRGDLLRGGRTSGRGQRGELVQLVAHHLGTLGARRSRADRVDADPARAELRRPCLGEQGQRGLAGAVERHARDAEVGHHGQHVDDRAPAPGCHRGRELAGQDERRLDVDRVDRVDVLVAGARGGPEREHAGVVDQDVDVPAAEFDGPALVIAEAGTNAVSTFQLSRGGTGSLLQRTATGQAATCWVTTAGSFLFASNAGTPSESGFTTSASGQLSLLGNTATDPGAVDAGSAAGGRFLYVQTGGNGIVDEFSVAATGVLTKIGAVSVPGAVGGEGIVAS